MKRHSARRADAATARILIAEDHPVNLIFLEQLLRSYGFRNIDLADDGKKAADACAKTPYDIVFMDCQMPVMDGYAATAQIRAYEKESGHAPTCIVAMTAHALAGEHDNCLRAGMDNYFAKPIDPKKLQTWLGEWFLLASASPEPAREPRPDDAPLDPARLRIVAPTPEKERQIIDQFVTMANDALRIMKETGANEDLKQWRIVAHRVRGSAANLGMGKLEELCREAEFNAPDYPEERSALIKNIESEIARIRAYAGT